MEQDRYRKNEIAYIIGMLCLMASLALFALSFYVFPNLAFGWRYGIPDFIPLWSNLLQESYKLSEKGASWFIFLSFFFSALILAVIADILSHRIDNKINALNERINPMKKTKRSEEGESNRLIMKILGIILLVFVVAQFFQWVISSSPATV